MIKAFWHQSDNFGDKLTSYILDKMGIPFEYTEKGLKAIHLIMSGSIITAANEHSVIWGTGLAQPAEMTKPLMIFSVRGQKTRWFLIDNKIECPEIYADATYLLPMFYFPKTGKKRNIGFIPHTNDRQYYPDSWNINAPVEDTIRFICESEIIISSSLHAIMTADVYGIPFQWLKSNSVIGQEFKFEDFLTTQYDRLQIFKSFLELLKFLGQ